MVETTPRAAAPLYCTARSARRPLRAALAALAALVLLAGLAAPAGAQTVNRSLDILSGFYQTDLRALGMGNAFGAVARGESALFYNPAGLVQYDFDWKLEGALAVEGERGDFFSDTYDQLTGSPSLAEVQDYLARYNGTSQRYRAQTLYDAVINMAVFNLGFGGAGMDQQRYTFTFNDVNNDGYTPPDGNQDNLVLERRSLEISFLGAGLALFNGKLLVGATFKNFTYAEESATQFYDQISDIDLTLSGNSYDGSSYDVGFIYRVEWLSWLRPQWSVTAFNVGGVTLEETGAPTIEVPASYNVGITFSPELPWSPFHLIVSAEWEDFTNAIKVQEVDTGTGNVVAEHDRSFTQRVHYGAELGFWEIATGNHLVSARAGYHRGALSRGFEINLWHGFRAVYTRYTEDFGHTDQSDEHELEAIQLSLGFGF